jgi:hypothetical protein
VVRESSRAFAIKERLPIVLRSIKAYESKIILFSSLKFHLEEGGITTKVEYKVDRPGQEPDAPDLFVLANPFTFIEEKGSLPSNPAYTRLEIEKVLSYEAKHSFEGKEFVPQVALLCPEDVYADKKQFLEDHQSRLAVLVYEFPVEDPITLRLVQGKLRAKELEVALVGPEIPHARKVIPTVKFLRSDPPIVYSAWTIWQVMWTYTTTSLSDFTVEYRALVDQCRKFYPGWLGADTEQVTYGRLNDALGLLSYVGWIEYKGKLGLKSSVTVHFSKGDKLRSHALEYLSAKSIEMMFKRQARVVVSGGPTTPRLRKAKASQSDTKLDSWT